MTTDALLQTAVSLAPAVLSVATASDPALAGVVALAPIAMQFLQNAIQLQNAGAMTPAQLAALFATVGQGVQSTHDKWAAMNATTTA